MRCSEPDMSPGFAHSRVPSAESVSLVVRRRQALLPSADQETMMKFVTYSASMSLRLPAALWRLWRLHARRAEAR